MSDNVGLSTPRGSGTSGYVQRNLAHIRPRDRAAPYPPRDSELRQHRQRKPDESILDHKRKRELYRKEFEYKIELLDELEKEEDELDEEERKEFDKKCAEFKKKQLEGLGNDKGKSGPREQFKGHQVHEMADAKLKEMDRMGKALRIPSNYEEGSHWRRQEERMKNALDGGLKDVRDNVERHRGTQGKTRARSESRSDSHSESP